MTDRYTYHITWSDEDNEYVALCHEFPSLSWLEPTAEAAFAGIRQLVADILADMQTTGETPPTPMADLIIPDEHYPLEFVAVGVPNLWSDSSPPAVKKPAGIRE